MQIDGILWQLSGLVVEFQPAVMKVLRSNPGRGNPGIFKIDFHQQKLSSLSIAGNIQLEGDLYSMFYAGHP